MKRFRITYTWKDFSDLLERTTFESTLVVYAENKTEAKLRFERVFKFQEIKRIIELK